MKHVISSFKNQLPILFWNQRDLCAVHKRAGKLKHLCLLFMVVTALPRLGAAQDAKAQELQPYLLIAENNSPQIQAYQLQYESALEKVNEVDALPNTQLSLGYFVSEPETRTGAQRARFSISQMLPWFGTITARENYASAMAAAEYVDLAVAKRQLTLNVAQSYYDLYALKAKEEVLQKNIQLLKTYEQLALTAVEIGKASAVDVLRLQIRQNELNEQLLLLQQESLAAKRSFNLLLNRAEDEAVAVVDQLEIPEQEADYDALAIQIHPELLKYDKLYESVSQSELLNQKEAAPSIGFGLDYVPVAERPDLNFSDNGKDIIMPMLSLSIPIFNNKFHSLSKQNELKQKELEAQKSERLQVLKTAFAKAVSQRNQAKIKYNTLVNNLKQAADAEDILIKNYETGTIDFNDVLDIQELQLKFQLNQIQAISKYYSKTAIINYLIN